jgi:hypothetical protein
MVVEIGACMRMGRPTGSKKAKKNKAIDLMVSALKRPRRPSQQPTVPIRSPIFCALLLIRWHRFQPTAKAR